jgi:6-pyruvoyl-tetrahydropterin synthase
VQPLDGSPDEGMVCDFGVLDQLWSEVKDDFDHRDLNQFEGGPERTTSELLADWFYWYFSEGLEKAQVLSHHEVRPTVDFVRISESPQTWAEVRP